jgi:hypothetical protein
MKTLASYLNGNSKVKIFNDGTRLIEYEDKMDLEYPLNIDLRVSTACSLGYNPKTGKSVCEFCHESATVDGKECDYDKLKDILKGLPKGIEIAIGGNKLTENLIRFLNWLKKQGFITNLTANQLHINRDEFILKCLMLDKIIYGLGISYRKDFPLNIDRFFMEHPNVILHVIAGIDDVDNIIETPFNKILILGYKKFGFGIQYYSKEVKESLNCWYCYVKKLMDVKKVVSFDNLAIEQLNIKRFFNDKKWNEFYQGEHSMYINAVDGYFSPSSRSDEKESWDNIKLINYFQNLEKSK